MSVFDKLPPRIVEEGQAHPFVEALLDDLKRELKAMERSLRLNLTVGTFTVEEARVMAGRIAGVESVLLKITQAQGKEDDGPGF